MTRRLRFLAALPRAIAATVVTAVARLRKTWGWGADPIKKHAETEYLRRFDLAEEAPTSGDMCSSCDDRFQLTFDGMDGAA